VGVAGLHRLLRHVERFANADAPLTASYGNGGFVGPRWRGRLMRSTDSVRWEETHRGEQHLEAVTFGQMGK